MRIIQLLAFTLFFHIQIFAQSAAEINALQELAATFSELNWAGGNVCAFEGVTCDNTNNIIALDIGNNALEGTIPNSIGDLVNLKRLYLENNFFSEIPSTIGNLGQLEELFVFNNEITDIPSELQNLTNLKRFWASSNVLTSAPNVLSNMSGLQYINLSFNEIEEIPDYFSAFTQLENLLLEQNKIEALPNDLGNLSLLQRLNIKNNQIKKMPDNITDITGIQFLLVGNNKLPFHVLESIKDLSFLSFDYSPQDSLEEVKNEMLAIGASLNLISGDESPNSSYQWYLNGDAIDSATDNEYMITEASTADFGIYTCEITNSTFPSMTLWTSDINVEEDATSATQLHKIGIVAQYPNPASDYLVFEMTNHLTGSVAVELYNNLGQKIISKQEKKIGNSFQNRLDISALPQGHYHLKISIEHYIFSETISKK